MASVLTAASPIPWEVPSPSQGLCKYLLSERTTHRELPSQHALTLLVHTDDNPSLRVSLSLSSL